jgi:hypothetical protein
LAEVFAGFVAGFIFSLVAAPLGAMGLLTMRSRSPLLEAMLPAGVPAVSVTMLVHFALFFFCTGVGLILGMVLLAMEGAGSGLGSPNAAYTLFVFGLLLALVAPFALLVAPARRFVVGSAIVALLVFGWLLPYMAEWSKFD